MTSKIVSSAYSGKKKAYDWLHHMHKRFFVLYSVASLGAMTDPNDEISFTFTTVGPLKDFRFWGIGTAGWRLRLYEAPTGGGASPTGSLTILNKNRNSSTTATVKDVAGTPAANKVSYDATSATGATTLWDEYLEGSGNVIRGGNVALPDEDLTLKAATTYQLSLYGTDANPAAIGMSWQED